MRSIGWVLSLAMLGGCPGGTIPTTVDASVVPDMAITVEVACADAAMAFCTRVNSCAPFLISIQYSDVAACQARYAIACKLALGAPSTAQTPANADACALALNSLSCDDLFASKLPDTCKPVKGSIIDGLACADNAQCSSTFCAKQRGMSCGVCGPRPVAGADCTKIDCGENGLTCAANLRCVVPAVAGASCDANHPCIASLGCQGATTIPNVKMGTCVVPLGTAGTTCDPNSVTTPPCDGTRGLFCNQFANNVCDSVVLAGTGEACGVANMKLAICKASGHCTKPFPQTGTCLAAAADGAACDDVAGPKCTPPAHCVNSACKIDDPASCK